MWFTITSVLSAGSSKYVCNLFSVMDWELDETVPSVDGDNFQPRGSSYAESETNDVTKLRKKQPPSGDCLSSRAESTAMDGGEGRKMLPRRSQLRCSSPAKSKPGKSNPPKKTLPNGGGEYRCSNSVESRPKKRTLLKKTLPSGGRYSCNSPSSSSEYIPSSGIYFFLTVIKFMVDVCSQLHCIYTSIVSMG